MISWQCHEQLRIRHLCSDESDAFRKYREILVRRITPYVEEPSLGRRSRHDGSDCFAESKAVAAIMSRAPSQRRLLYVGSDAPHKNLAILAEGIGLVRAEMSDAKLFMTLPRDHPICATDGVECLGVLSSSDVYTAYRLATALCQPSIAETVGLPMLEAMSSGTPVVASERPYARDIRRDAA